MPPGVFLSLDGDPLTGAPRAHAVLDVGEERVDERQHGRVVTPRRHPDAHQERAPVREVPLPGAEQPEVGGDAERGHDEARDPVLASTAAWAATSSSPAATAAPTALSIPEMPVRLPPP